MAQPKPLASLSSTLLARKGTARPAMRPQLFGGGVAAKPSPADDLGWNDMGEPAPDPVVVTPISVATARRISREGATLGKGAKAAFTLRLERERHLRLRLASALAGVSSQKLVTQALDAFLLSMPEVEALVAQLPPAKTASR
jgi:hypothetical protein